jgi:hypothetical protein
MKPITIGPEAARLLREFYISYPIIRHGICLYNEATHSPGVEPRYNLRDLDALEKWVHDNLIAPVIMGEESHL